MKCICCEKTLKVLHRSKGGSNYFNGDVNEIFIGYGSDFDLARLIVGLCDDCIRDKLARKIIKRNKDGEKQDKLDRAEKSREILKKHGPFKVSK